MTGGAAARVGVRVDHPEVAQVLHPDLHQDLHLVPDQSLGAEAPEVPGQDRHPEHQDLQNPQALPVPHAHPGARGARQTGAVVITTAEARKIVERAASVAHVTVLANDGFWLAPLSHRTTINRVYCRPVSEAGHQKNIEGQESKCVGPVVLNLLNSVSDLLQVQWWNYLLWMFLSSMGDFADLELDLLYRGTK